MIKDKAKNLRNNIRFTSLGYQSKYQILPELIDWLIVLRSSWDAFTWRRQHLPVKWFKRSRSVSRVLAQGVIIAQELLWHNTSILAIDCHTYCQALDDNRSIGSININQSNGKNEIYSPMILKRCFVVRTQDEVFLFMYPLCDISLWL